MSFLNRLRLWLRRHPDGVAVPSAAYAGAVMADRPLVYWRLNEPGDRIANDSSGNGLDGLYAGTIQRGVPGAIAGDPDLAIRLEGRDGLILPPEALNRLVSDFTVEAWFRNISDGLPYPQIMGTRGSRWARFNFGRWPDNRWKLTKFGVTDIFLGEVPTDAAWHHAVLVYSGTEGTLFYLDGDLHASHSNLSGLSAEYPFPVIGAAAKGGHYGDLDEVAVYDYVLGPDRIRAHFRLGRGLT